MPGVRDPRESTPVEPGEGSTPPIRVVRAAIGPRAMAEVERAVNGLALARRGPGADDCYEAWLPDGMLPADCTDALDALARNYAREVLNACADTPSPAVCNCYFAGQACLWHVDQYAGRGVPDTLDRTVSASLIVERAAAGGDMVFQDPGRKRRPVRIDPPPGSLVLFPADWWHRVAPATAGIRRSLVRWWAQSNGERFSSLARPDGG